MNEASQSQFDKFFASIAPWRAGYSHARLHVLGVRGPTGLSIVIARIYLDISDEGPLKPHFSSGQIEAFQWPILQQGNHQAVENVITALVSDAGLHIEGVGNVRLASNERQEIYAAPPILLHPEGLNAGNRLALLTISGSNLYESVPQPDSDWALKAAEIPYDSIHELCNEYGVGLWSDTSSKIEVVARTAVQVLARSRVEGTIAELGIWMGSALDRNAARLGYRIINNGTVLKRASIAGSQLTWQDEGLAVAGIIQIDVPTGSVVQCIASYGERAQHVQWRVDPRTHVNPRAAALSIVDPQKEVMRAFLQPDRPLRGSASTDFESAVAWLLWALGFSTATFGTNSKTKDAFDTIVVSPSGDFAVIECTLTLLRADSKLSKLAARAIGLREALAASNMNHLRVLPVMISAMTLEEIKVDIPSAEENGILVLTQENLAAAMETELSRFPNADDYFNRGVARVEERKLARAKSDIAIDGGVF